MDIEMALPKMMVECIVCETEFRMGSDVYAGKWLPSYQMYVCDACFAGNWDGYATDFDERIVQHLNSKGLPIPQRNARGYLPRE